MVGMGLTEFAAALWYTAVSDIVSLCIPVSIESPFFRNLRALGYVSASNMRHCTLAVSTSDPSRLHSSATSSPLCSYTTLASAWTASPPVHPQRSGAVYTLASRGRSSNHQRSALHLQLDLCRCRSRATSKTILRAEARSIKLVHKTCEGYQSEFSHLDSWTMYRSVELRSLGSHLPLRGRLHRLPWRKAQRTESSRLLSPSTKIAMTAFPSRCFPPFRLQQLYVPLTRAEISPSCPHRASLSRLCPTRYVANLHPPSRTLRPQHAENPGPHRV